MTKLLSDQRIPAMTARGCVVGGGQNCEHEVSLASAAAVAMDKWATKLVAQALGIAVAPGVLLTRETAATYLFTGPVVIKPVSSGSSHGVRLVEDAAQLPAALEAALDLCARVLVEDRVIGREVDVAVLGRLDGSRMVAPALEIVVHEVIFDSTAKYDAGIGYVELVDLLVQDVLATNGRRP